MFPLEEMVKAYPIPLNVSILVYSSEAVSF